MTESEVETPDEASNYSQETQLLSPKVRQRSPYPIYIVSLLFYLGDAIGTNIVLEAVVYNKVCYSHFANVSLCTNATFSKNHPDLQEDAARWGNYIAAIQIVPAVLTNLLLSSYSDRIGHRLPICLPAISFALAAGALAVLATDSLISLPIELLLVYGFLYSFLGGSPLLIMSCYSYITLISSNEKMSFNMVVLEASTEMGFLIGVLASGPLADHFGLDTLSYINVGVSITPIIVLFLAVKEIHDSQAIAWIDAIGVKYMLDSAKCVFKKRPSYNRLLIHLCYLTNFIGCFSVIGYGANSFLYFTKQLGMSLTQFSLFSAVIEVAIGFGGPAIIFLNNKVFKLDNISFGVLSCAVLALAYIIMSINSIPGGIWIGAALLSFQITIYGIIRSFQVKFVDENEIGKLFAYDGMLKVLFNLVSKMVFKEMYSFSVVVYPSLFLVVCGGLYIFAMLTLILIGRLSRTTSADAANYTALDNDTVTS